MAIGRQVLHFLRWQPAGVRTGELIRLGCLVLVAAWWGADTSHVLTAQEAGAQESAIAQTALNAQNAGDFPLAATQWEKLLSSHPETSLKGLAQHNLGVCKVQTALASEAGGGDSQSEFQQAIDALKNSLASLDSKETEKLARSYLFLGFAQARLGKNISLEAEKTGETSAADESRKWLTTATQTLEQLQRRFPGFADLDQAYFFQGEAYATLDRLDKAAEAYEKMLGLPKQTFKFDGILALADTREQLGQYDQAISLYDRFEREAAAAGGHELLTESKFRKAETLLKLALAAETRGEPQRAQKIYATAGQIMQEVAAESSFENRDRALFQQAYAANRQRQFEKSAQLYKAVAQLPSSTLANRAQVYSGRDYLSAQQFENAERELSAALQAENEFAPEAAHWLAQCYLRTRNNDQAFQLADQWVKKTPADHAMLVPLKLDRADAAYMVDEQRPSSPEMFLELAENHPDHALAPTALYNAAFANLETGLFDQAIQLADRFINEYSDSDYLADTLEVKADASLLADNPQVAETVFRQLVRDYSANPKVAIWNLRIGLALYMQDKYQATIDWLSPLTQHIDDKAQRAEALHWIGSSHFNLNQDEAAMSALQQSFSSDSSWRRADETLSTLSRAQNRAGQADLAVQTSKTLIDNFPDSPLVAQAHYRLGELAFSNNEYGDAQNHYNTLVANFPDSEFVPHALYGTAWSLLEQKQFDQAIATFDKLIAEHSDHERAGQARVGRGVSRRLSGDATGAIEDLSAFLQSGPDGQAEIDALYELGLAQVAAEKWPDVVDTFTTLLERSPDSNLADRFHYEIAWAHQSSDNKDDALEHFSIIANQFESSPLAAEASFHVGNNAYDNQNYEEAIKAYARSLDAQATDDLREKAAYKRAWAHYKLKDYERAVEQFQQQVAQFPEGQLRADGLLMVSDSLYRLEKHEQAFEAYRVARPVIEASNTVEARVRWQALLHGGQSANKAGRHAEAIEFVTPIVESSATSEALKHDAWLEIGNAHKGNRDLDAAQSAWEKAAVSTGETGAEARCLIGELLFEQRKLDEAINAYKLVFYGYGGKQSPPDIKPWQAFAVFEAAQCNYVQIKDAQPPLQSKFIDEAKKLFQYLIDNYPDDRLVPEAKNRLAKLNQLTQSQNN